MTIRKIAQIGHPILRQEARTLEREELATPSMQTFIDDLIQTMRDANGAGLAATQVYEDFSICCMEVHNNPRYPYKPNLPLTVLVNPTIEVIGTEVFDNYEGCLSVPNLRGVVSRAMHIRVRAWDRDGHDIDTELRGITAGTYQHEVDHLQGMLFVDQVKASSLCTLENFRRYQEQDFALAVKTIVDLVGS